MAESKLVFPDRVVLLDGSMGRELRKRGVETRNTIWSATALLVAPQEVVNVHLDNIAAGADIITTNTYGIIRHELAREGIESEFESLNVLACELALQSREQSSGDVLIAGSLPPLRGSYRPDLVGDHDEIEPLYEEQANILAKYADLIICETMSSAEEALAAATAACKTGKTVWVSWNLHDRHMGVLRSGETITRAHELIKHLPISGFLCNCCPPESISAGMLELANLGTKYFGGYANTFVPIKADWMLDGHAEDDGVIIDRDDLVAESYAEHAVDWLEKGATVIGGCCGTSPDYIAKLKALIA
ncbi:MAG: homocysteine S-methyltransferase family protein [Gammaproteobacteria bacterium]|nr:homocysteine S-methyltransferase family protein [Gammaproteobacteria bacterium]